MGALLERLDEASAWKGRPVASQSQRPRLGGMPPDHSLRSNHRLEKNAVSAFSTKRSLSASRRQLLELMQRYNFCRIENLEVRGGEPVFNPALRVTQDIKIGAENGPRPELEKHDFLLRAPVIELFQHFDRFGDGRIALIEVRYGLPCRLVVEQPVFQERS